MMKVDMKKRNDIFGCLFRWQRNKDGNAVIEAAFVFPVLITLLFGVVDVGNAVILDTKVVSAAQITSDLIARENTATDDSVAEAILAARSAMLPYSRDTLGVEIIGVLFDGPSASPTIEWRDATPGMALNSSAVTNADGLGNEDEGVVIVTVEYKYTPRFSSFATGEVTMREVSYVRGRDSTFVARETSASN